MKALIVSEDAAFIAQAQHLALSRGSSAVGSLGAPDASWLPVGVGLAIVDAPASGAFAARRPGGRVVRAGRYAERLSDQHPGLLVVICDPSETGGESGGLAHVANHQAALDLLSTAARDPEG
jgi:hypothetical protein